MNQHFDEQFAKIFGDGVRPSSLPVSPQRKEMFAGNKAQLDKVLLPSSHASLTSMCRHKGQPAG